MKVIVGLGNPGKEYKKTRHNVGFMALDNFLGEVKWETKFEAEIYQTIINGEKILFVKPMTFMNLSGNSVRKIYDFYKLNSNDFLIIHDDMDLTTGTIRFKYDSSSGGHNGIKSIISNLGSQKFHQLKIGIGQSKIDVVNYVIGQFGKSELEIIDKIDFKTIITYYLENGIDKAMNLYNTK